MKTLLVLFVLCLSVASQADIIKCTFTEPFVSTTYSMTQSTLTYNSFDHGVKVLKNVSLQFKAQNRFDLVDSRGRILQRLTLNMKGSDGMSDRVYPYTVRDTSMLPYANNGYGGCESNYLRATNP